jgi:hypothetical protein
MRAEGFSPQRYLEGSQILSVRALPKVGKDGFFEATLAPLPKMQFKHNVVCLVSFFPNLPDQDATVTGTVGSRETRGTAWFSQESAG